MASTPIFYNTPKLNAVNITAALGGTRATPTGASTLVTGATGGSLVPRAWIQNIAPVGSGAASANVARFYLHNGTTYFLKEEYGFTAVNADVGIASPPFEVVFNDLVVPAGWTLQCGLSVRASDVDDTCISAPSLEA